MVEIKQISSLAKVRDISDIPDREIKEARLLLNESYSYQVIVSTDAHIFASVTIDSPISELVEIYSVKNAAMDFPMYELCGEYDNDLISVDKGLMPDILEPIEKNNGRLHIREGVSAVWVTVKIPENLKAGEYPITLCVDGKYENGDDTFSLKSEMKVEVLTEKLPEPELIYTQWLHVDCIATAHDTDIYSEKHWRLIEKYIKTAAELGVNMILTPVLTPPLDTAVGGKRPNTQLVKIEKKGTEYIFDFTLLKRWIDVCKDCGIKYFEISHLFTQWGAGFAPNIYVTENGEEKHMFGWHTPADGEGYVDFLKAFLPELIEFLREENIAKSCYFHLSDEPAESQLESYRKAHDIAVPFLEGFKTLDAISDLAFYKKGLIPVPVCATNVIMPFIENKTEHLWAYYCCGQWDGVGNRFLAMPSYRNRILGLQLYKYNIEGFLHWGYNFYFSQFSEYEINPYLTTSSDRAFPSGDPFSVYPGKEGPLKSLRAQVFYEALQDIRVCQLLEEKVGRAAVVKMIDDEAGMNITFAEYPKNQEYIPDLINKMKAAL